MNKWIEKIKEYWKDPVWSKVIATGIVFVFGVVFTWLYAIFQSIYSKVSFVDTFKSIGHFLEIMIQLPLWGLLLLGAVFIVFTLKPIVAFFNSITEKISKPKQIKPKKKISFATDHSTVLFSDRMAKAFPGLRGVTWFNKPSEAIERLQLLLKEPLRFENGSIERESDPIWWFRGYSALFIHKFKKLRCGKVLMNVDQLKIKRIAAFQSDSYYRSFVYVEAIGEEQTGLYNITKDKIEDSVKTFGYCWEEYGLIKYLHFWKKPIRREHYDDGATIIRGKVVNVNDAELRVRYITDYNFIIAAKGSPYNSTRFDRESLDYFNGMLTGKVEFNDFLAFMQTLNKNDR